MDSSSISILKKEVEKTFGRRLLTSLDCQSLSDDIFRTSMVRISFNTIRRVFNLIKDGGTPSIDTLNALSNYCGFFSFDLFLIERYAGFEKKHEKQDQIILCFLTSIFKKIKVSRKNDSTYQHLVKQAILHIERRPSIIDPFLREISKTKNGQRFYFENFVFIDKLNSYYGKGLHYYLKAKKTKEAQLFGYSLLCYKSWLNHNKENVEKYYLKVLQYDVDKSISNAANARYFTTLLFYNNLFEVDENTVLKKARIYYSHMKKWDGCYSHFNCFEIILAEALILISRFDEALFYIEELLAKFNTNRKSHIDISLYETVRLLKAIVNAQMGKKINSVEILKDLNPERFSFLTKQYLSILYLSLKQNMRSNNLEQKQIEHLVQQTGFLKLSGIWQDKYEVDGKRLNLA